MSFWLYPHNSTSTQSPHNNRSMCLHQNFVASVHHTRQRKTEMKIVHFVLLFVFVFTYVSSMSIIEPSKNSQSSTKTSSHNDVASEARSLNLFSKTPLRKDDNLSKLLQRDVFLKLDSMQPSGSFKDRGIGHLCSTIQEQTTKLISSSGGNAGLAAATVGQALQMSVQVIVPQTTKPNVIAKLRSLHADVTIHGENWNAADTLARQLVDQDPSAYYVSPYDNALLWTGHSTVVDEIFEELHPIVPSCIIASVGGGGLLCGILEGLHRRQSRTAVIAAETVGAASFGQSFRKKEIVTLEKIDSIATSLGALQVTPVALQRAKQHQEWTGKDDMVQISLCTDAEAVDACVKVRFFVFRHAPHC